LVAFYSTRDKHHAWAFAQLDALRPPLLTCEAVLTEACFLLQRGAGSPAAIMRAVREQVIQILNIETEAASLEVLMERHSDVPMSLADACLVRLSELHSDCRVLTLDSHFTSYRRHGRRVIPLLTP
jgi:predicted nucleic acid-binding protein